MPLPRLSPLFRDPTKNLGAGACPVARVPVTASGVFDFRVLCVSAFGPNPSHRGTGVQSSDLQPPQLFPPLQPPVSNSGFGSPVDSPGVQRPDLQPLEPTSPLQCAVAQKRACKSFAIRTYKSLDLKSPGMNTYKKYGGGGPLRSLQTLDLVRIFHCEGGTSYKSLDLKCPEMNTYKKHRGDPSSTSSTSSTSCASCTSFTCLLLAFNHRARLLGDFLRVLCACGTVQW